MELNRINAGRLEKESFHEMFGKDGYVIVEDVFTPKETDAVIPDLEAAIEKEFKAYGNQDNCNLGTLVACPVYGGGFLDILANRTLFKPVDWLLGESSIIWVYTSSSMPPGSGNRATKLHVDRPHFIPGFLEAAGSLILLNDLTEANGATYFVPGSHLLEQEPDEKEFYEKAVRLVAPRGSVFYFNLRLWHAGGINRTDVWRHMLGIGYIRPYIKQRIDLPRAMSHLDLSGLPDRVMQKLGFHSGTPASVQDYYSRTTYVQKSEWDKSV